DDGKKEVVEEVAHWSRRTLQPEELGLTLAEAKDLLKGVQHTMVAQQTAEFIEPPRRCPDCGAERAKKGRHSIVFRSLFGKLNLASPRWYACACQAQGARSFSPLANLIKERSAPELVYLETKWASLMSYGLTVDLLEELLPLGAEVNKRTVRRQVHRVG